MIGNLVKRYMYPDVHYNGYLVTYIGLIIRPYDIDNWILEYRIFTPYNGITYPYIKFIGDLDTIIKEAEEWCKNCDFEKIF